MNNNIFENTHICSCFERMGYLSIYVCFCFCLAPLKNKKQKVKAERDTSESREIREEKLEDQSKIHIKGDLFFLKWKNLANREFLATENAL